MKCPMLENNEMIVEYKTINKVSFTSLLKIHIHIVRF